MEGGVVPSRFWDSEDDFFRNGLAYALFYKGELASMAFSSYWFDDQFELGIETKDKFRGKGFAELVCSALIDYCISHDYEPIWACRLENSGSYKLAQKLGFKPGIEIPYYRLSN
jgi:RimJ/RimL family protein N-acetyltransferase